MDKPIEILYIDNHLIVVKKPAGMLVQGDSTGRITLFECAKRFIKEHYQKSGEVFLGLVHRLDRPVSGVVVFARTSKGAARLSEQIRNHQFKKSYIALVEGETPKDGQYIDYLTRKDHKAVQVKSEHGRYSELYFKRLHYRAGISGVEIELKTGRYHQIRAQFSARGFPIIGDRKYGSKKSIRNDEIALHAVSTTFYHPVRNELLTITTQIDKSWDEIYKYAEGLIE